MFFQDRGRPAHRTDWHVNCEQTDKARPPAIIFDASGQRDCSNPS
jgi:hypothetical protein